MLLVEPIIHRVSSHPGLTAHHTPLPTSGDALSSESHAQSAHVEFDVELGELEQAEGVAIDGPSPIQRARNKDVPPTTPAAVAYPLTLGLVVHALSDGFALGSSAISPVDDSLTLVVFLALMVHKGICCMSLLLKGANACPKSSAYCSGTDKLPPCDVSVAFGVPKTYCSIQRFHSHRSFYFIRTAVICAYQ